MGYVGTYDRTIFYNPSNKYCIISVKTSDQSVPQQARSAYHHRDNMIRFIAVGYELPQTDKVSMILDGEWENGIHGVQLQVDKCEEIVPQTKEGVYGYLSSRLIKGVGEKTAALIVNRFGADALRVLEIEPERLLEIVEELKDSYYSYDGMDMDDAATTVAYDIFDAYMDTPEYKTYAQRQNDRFTAMQNKYRKRLLSDKDDYRQRYEEKLKAVQSKSRQDKADMRTQYADQLKAQRQLYAERRHRDVEKRRKTVQKNKIKKQILDLMSLAANGGKERRVPKGLLDRVKELGRAVVLDGKAGERLDSYLNKVRDGFDKIEGNDSQKTEYATLVEDYNNLFKGQILQLKESIGDKSINDMTADEL